MMVGLERNATMSKPLTPHLLVAEWVRREGRKHSGTVCAVALAVGRRMVNATTAWPGVNGLSADVGAHCRTVERALMVLERAGVFSRVSVDPGRGRKVGWHLKLTTNPGRVAGDTQAGTPAVLPGIRERETPARLPQKPRQGCRRNPGKVAVPSKEEVIGEVSTGSNAGVPAVRAKVS